LASEIVTALDEAGICVSSGSACHSDSTAASPVLAAMKVPNSLALGSIRFSLGRYNATEDIGHTVSILRALVGRLLSNSA
jgi:cysteine desulfurase